MKTTVCLFLFLLPVMLLAQQPAKKTIEYSLSFGSILPGTVKGSYEDDYPDDETADVKNEICPMLKGSFDYYLVPFFSLGAGINYAAFRIKDVLWVEDGRSLIDDNDKVNLGTWDGREHIIPLTGISNLELTLSAKYRYVVNDQLVFKGCLYLGYRRTFSDSQDARNEGMVLNYNIEGQYYITDKCFLQGDLGIISQPYGGIHHVAHVRTFGIPYLSVGVGMGL